MFPPLLWASVFIRLRSSESELVDEGKLDPAPRHLTCGGYDSNVQALLLARGE
jgi:hypothetical protein